MSLIIGGTTIKKIMYNGTKLKKANCDGVNVFNAEHVVTYRIKGQTWTATIDDGENAVTATANAAAAAKMGSGDTFVGWTTSSTGKSPSGTIACNADNMTLYGIWKHAHVGTNTTKAGCYQGAASTIHYTRNTGNTNWSDSCGCTHTRHSWHCDNCGRNWTSQTNRSDGCTQGHHVSDDGSSSCCPSVSTYAVSCGKSAGTFNS